MSLFLPKSKYLLFPGTLPTEAICFWWLGAPSSKAAGDVLMFLSPLPPLENF